jgi:polar amino acid transport system substrate-binding protein
MLPLEEFTSMSPSTPLVTTVSTNPSAPVQAKGGSADLALLTGNDSTGLAGEDRSNGGVVPALVKRALSASNPTLGQVNLSFIDDRDAHVEALLPRAGFALSFPWRMPDCEQPANLTPNQQLLCRDFAFSDSIYTLAVSVFINRGRAPDQAQGFGVLSAMKLCASEPADLMVLRQGGARILNENLRMTSSSSECFDLLASGEVDALVADASSFDQALLARGDAQKFEEAPWLGGLSSVHAIAFKGNQAGMTALGQLNAGLDEIKTSGEWFDVIARQLSNP